MAYTLTFADAVECRIGDRRIYSPYTLNNGDSIQVYSTAGNMLTINGTEYKLSAEVQSIDVSDTDINITVNAFPPALSEHYLTINFSAASANRISVDMSTLSGWANIAAGSHTLTVKAKADGYGTSDASTGVTFTKAAAGYTVTVSWSDDYSLWKSLQYSTDSGSTWVTMPGYEAGSSGNATLAVITGKIRFKISGDGGYCAVYKDGSYTHNNITMDGQSPDYTITANTSFGLIGSD